MSPKTAALLIGFGGPTRMEEVLPFLRSVTEGSNIPESRLKEVLHHYEIIGGASPFNAVTNKQKEALERYFKAKSAPLSVAAAFRHSTPSFQDAFETFKKYGIEKVVGLVLASFRSFASWQKYQEKLLLGRREAGAEHIEIVYTDAFDTDPLFLDAQAGRVEGLTPSTFVIFTAHSIPVSMSEQSAETNRGRSYARQFEEAASGIAGRLGISKNWTIAYQSRSGRPTDAWLEPDIKDVLKGLDRKKYDKVCLVPVGFLCDNVEVIYDLDVEARQTCAELGLVYSRASTVTDHPAFIEMMGRRILDKV